MENTKKKRINRLQNITICIALTCLEYEGLIKD